MDAVRRWFSFRGRTGRLGYWRAQLGGVLVLAVIWCGGLILVDSTGEGGFGAIALAAFPIAVLFQSATLFRRVHDRNKSGWWLLVFYVLPLGIVAVIESPPAAGRLPPAELVGLALVELVLLLWGWIELGFMRGTPGPNRYGEDPAAA